MKFQCIISHRFGGTLDNFTHRGFAPLGFLDSHLGELSFIHSWQLRTWDFIAPRNDYEVIDHVTKICNPIGAQAAERSYKRQLTRPPDPSLPVRKWAGPRD